MRGACGGHVEVGFDPHGRIPQVGELRPLQEDPVDDKDEFVRPLDAQHVRMKSLDVEPVEVVAVG